MRVPKLLKRTGNIAFNSQVNHLTHHSQPAPLKSTILSLTMLFKSFAACTLLAVAVTASPLQTRQYPYFGSINELGYCINPFNISACFAAQGHADVASAAAQSRFPTSTHNGKGDAYRHCYWNARMTIDFGATKAKEIGDAHEAGSSGPQAEKNMDLANNATGRSIGGGASGQSKDAKYANAEVTCRTRANNGQLVTL
jgi:hypothetical protein